MNVVVVEPCFDSSVIAGADSGDVLLGCHYCGNWVVSWAGPGSVSPKVLVGAVVKRSIGGGDEWVMLLRDVSEVCEDGSERVLQSREVFRYAVM